MSSPRLQRRMIGGHVLLLSWHSAEGAISAGGHRRTLELVQRFRPWGTLTIIDNHETMFDGVAGLRVIPYRLPRLKWVSQVDRRLARLVQWPLATVSLIRHGRRACRDGGIDTVYVPNSELLPCVLAGVALRRICRRPLVLCNMNAEGVALGGLVIALHNRADRVVALSPGLADALVHRGLRQRPRVIGCGTPVQQGPEDDEGRTKDWDAVFVGRHTRGKGILDLLDVWEAMRARRPLGRLVLVGSCSGEMARLIDDRCRERPLLDGAVCRLGVLSEREKNQVLSASRVLLFPSRIEGWGFVPLEALVRKVPVVCWDLPAYRASLPDHPSVVRVPVGQIEQFAASALRFLDMDDTALADLAASAPLDMPSWDDVAEQEWAVLCLPVGGQ